MDFAVNVAHRVLAANSRLDEVFHFQPLAELVTSLGGTHV